MTMTTMMMMLPFLEGLDASQLSFVVISDHAKTHCPPPGPETSLHSSFSSQGSSNSSSTARRRRNSKPRRVRRVRRSPDESSSPTLKKSKSKSKRSTVSTAVATNNTSTTASITSTATISTTTTSTASSLNNNKDCIPQKPLHLVSSTQQQGQPKRDGNLSDESSSDVDSITNTEGSQASTLSTTDSSLSTNNNASMTPLMAPTSTTNSEFHRWDPCTSYYSYSNYKQLTSSVDDDNTSRWNPLLDRRLQARRSNNPVNKEDVKHKQKLPPHQPQRRTALEILDLALEDVVGNTDLDDF